MAMVVHFKARDLVYTRTDVEGNYTTICRAVTNKISSSMGAGIETLENVKIEWTVTYDEILFIKDGSLTIRADGEAHECVEGDIVWLPKGTTLVYDAPEACTYFYALYPVDWAKQQGISEP
jgi:ethanolamine utilization protein EutQ (cupin superfamily)